MSSSTPNETVQNAPKVVKTKEQKQVEKQERQLAKELKKKEKEIKAAMKLKMKKQKEADALSRKKRWAAMKAAAAQEKKKKALEKAKALKKKRKYASELERPEMKATKRVRNKSSAWVQYTKKRRPEMSKDLTFGEQVKRMSVEWAAMSDKDKAPYVLLKEEDEKRFVAEYENRTPDQIRKDKLIRRMRAKKRRQKNEQKHKDGFPKAPLSAFMFFSKDKRADIVAKNPTLSFPDTGRALGAAWKALSDKKKRVYMKMHDADYKVFQIAKEKYDLKMVASDAVSAN